MMLMFDINGLVFPVYKKSIISHFLDFLHHTLNLVAFPASFYNFQHEPFDGSRMIRINITLGSLTFFSFSIASFRFNFTSFIDGFCVSKSSTRLGRSTPPSNTLVYRKQESDGSNNLNHHTNSQRFFLKFSISLSFIASTCFFLSSAS